MNQFHRWYCRSGHWRRTVRDRLLPWVVGRIELGDDVLEVGPGPGLTTDVLAERVPRLTCVEKDPRLAASLARRTAGSRATAHLRSPAHLRGGPRFARLRLTARPLRGLAGCASADSRVGLLAHVEVVEADATELPFAAGRFSGAVSCTMLHHVPSAALQDRLLCEVARVLAPGAWLVGSDSLVSPLFRLAHWGDTLVPVDPERFAARLERAGFEDVSVERAAQSFRFRARRVPNPDAPPC